MMCTKLVYNAKHWVQKKTIFLFLLIIVAISLHSIIQMDVIDKKNTLVVAVSPDYPPFEMYKNGHLVGFDIDLAQHLGQQLGKKIIFRPMDFPLIFVALRTKTADIAISAIVPTEQRRASFCFSPFYHQVGISMIFLRKTYPNGIHQPWSHIKAGCQLGSFMETWAKKGGFQELMLLDNSVHLIENLKTDRIDLAIVEQDQAQLICQKDPLFAYQHLPKNYNTDTQSGFSVAFLHDFSLKTPLQRAIENMKKIGTIEQLKKKWLLNHGVAPHI